MINMKEKLSWKKVKEYYEKRFNIKLNLKDWNTPEGSGVLTFDK